MNDLLMTAVKAHGGLKRWNEIKSIQVAAHITGAIWFVKGQGDYLKDIVMSVDTRKECMVTDFPGQNKRIKFGPCQIVMEKADGTLIEVRDDPEASFVGQQRETPWDDFHVAYFQGEALWTYLNIPFLYVHEGFVTEEITPIEVNGETWRRLKVTFPDHVRVTLESKFLALGRTACFDGTTTRLTFWAVQLASTMPPNTETWMASSFPRSGGFTPTKATTSL